MSEQKYSEDNSYLEYFRLEISFTFERNKIKKSMFLFFI